MAQRQYFVGDQYGGWVDQDFWPDGYSWDMPVFEEDKPVRAGELNLISQAAYIRLRDHLRRLFTSGWTKKGALTGNTLTVNTISLAESWLDVDGQVVHVGNPDTSSISQIPMPVPPGTGTRTDFVFLEVWVQEIASSGSTDLGGGTAVDRNIYKWGGVGNNTFANDFYWNDPTDPNEPSRRFQVRWRVRVLQNEPVVSCDGFDAQAGSTAPTIYSFSQLEQITRTNLDGTTTTLEVLSRAGDGSHSQGQTLNAVDGYCYALPIAQVLRTAGSSYINTGDITDLRIASQLGPGINVDISNINPSVFNQTSIFDHLVPVKFVYTGTMIAHGTGNPTSAQVNLGQGAYAQRIKLDSSQASGIAPELVGSSIGPVRRIEFNLQLLGTGSDVTVDICADSVTVPGAVLYSQLIPASWITSTARDVSMYFNTTAFTDQTYIWIVVHKTASAVNTALLATLITTDPTQLVLVATDGSTWDTGNPVAPLGFKIYNGNTDEVVHALVNGTDLYLYEYDVNANAIAIGERYLPTSGDSRRDNYLAITYDPNGDVLAVGT